MTKVLNDHHVTNFELDPYAPMKRWVAFCSCHSPDEYGEGRADFGGDTALEALQAWLEHVDPEGEVEIPDEPPMGSTVRLGGNTWPVSRGMGERWFRAGAQNFSTWAEVLAFHVTPEVDDAEVVIDTLAERWSVEIAEWEKWKPATILDPIPGTLEALNALTIRSAS